MYHKLKLWWLQNDNQRIRRKRRTVKFRDGAHLSVTNESIHVWIVDIIHNKLYIRCKRCVNGPKFLYFMYITMVSVHYSQILMLLYHQTLFVALYWHKLDLAEPIQSMCVTDYCKKNLISVCLLTAVGLQWVCFQSVVTWSWLIMALCQPH